MVVVVVVAGGGIGACGIGACVVVVWDDVVVVGGGEFPHPANNTIAPIIAAPVSVRLLKKLYFMRTSKFNSLSMMLWNYWLWWLAAVVAPLLLLSCCSCPSHWRCHRLFYSS